MTDDLGPTPATHTTGPAPVARALVRSVAVGAVGELRRGERVIPSAFVKAPVTGRVRLGRLGLPGDEHVYEHHGGPDMALLAYPLEHYAPWRAELGLDLPDAAAFGENLTTSGLTEADLHLGDVFSLGTATVQVCQPRTPCYKLAARFGVADMAVRVQSTGRTGYLLRVLEEGDIGAGDEMVLRHREGHGVTVAEAGRIVNVARRDIDGARRVLAVDSLGSAVRDALAARVAAADTSAANAAGVDELDRPRLFGDD